MQWVSVYLWSCVIITTIQFQNILSLQKETLYAMAVAPHFLLPHLQDNQWSESLNEIMQYVTFVTSFFPSA